MKLFNFLITALIICFASNVSLAQQPTFEWAKTMGGVDYDVANSICLDSQGNTYTTGYFQSTVDFDPGIGVVNFTSNGGDDIFIQKLDQNGNLLWAKAIGSASGDRGEAITIDPMGNIYLTGSFGFTTDFDPGVGVVNVANNGSNDIFILKLDDAGNFLWVKTMGGTNTDRAYSITTDSNGNVYTTGIFGSTVDFDPGPGILNQTSFGSSDIFVQKLDVNGNLIWIKTFGSTSLDEGRGIDVDVNGNVCVTGFFSSTVDVDPILPPDKRTDLMTSLSDYIDNLNDPTELYRLISNNDPTKYAIETIRFALAKYEEKGLDLATVEGIEIEFPDTGSGKVTLDNVLFTND